MDASIKSFEQSIEAATNKIVGEIDDASSKILMNELVFADADIAVTKTGAIKIEVEVKTKQEQSLFDGTVCAHVDGIIKAEFFSNNNAVRYAYLTLPMYGCYTFPQKINGICTSTTMDVGNAIVQVIDDFDMFGETFITKEQWACRS